MEPNGIPYDAGQIEMRHQGHPAHDWHPAALLRILSASCSTTPSRVTPRFRTQLERRVMVPAAAARLGEQGFDVDEIVRCVFRPMYVGEFIRLCSRVAFDVANGVDVPGTYAPLGCRVADRVGPPTDAESFGAYFRNRVVGHPEVQRLGRQVAFWIETTSLRRLLQWQFPSEREWNDLKEVDVFIQHCESRWLVDRYLLTYLSDWYTSSFHSEFEYANNDYRTTIREEVLALRRVPIDKLNAEIALRAVRGYEAAPRALISAGIDYLRRRRI